MTYYVNSEQRVGVVHLSGDEIFTSSIFLSCVLYSDEILTLKISKYNYVESARHNYIGLYVYSLAR